MCLQSPKMSGTFDHVDYIYIHFSEFCKAPDPVRKKAAYLQSIYLNTFFITSAAGWQTNSSIYIHIQLNHSLHNIHLQVPQENQYLTFPDQQQSSVPLCNQ